MHRNVSDILPEVVNILGFVELIEIGSCVLLVCLLDILRRRCACVVVPYQVSLVPLV